MNRALGKLVQPGQTLEKLSHSKNIELIRAVEDDGLDGQRFAQVFSGFRLTCACWTRWSTSKL